MERTRTSPFISRAQKVVLSSSRAESGSMRCRSVVMTRPSRRNSRGASPSMAEPAPMASSGPVVRYRGGAARPAPEKEQHGQQVGSGEAGADQDQSPGHRSKKAQLAHVHHPEQDAGGQKGGCSGEEQQLQQQKRPVPHARVEPV